MIKTIRIDNRPVEVNSSAGWLYVYNEQFGHDVLVVLMPAIEAFLKAAMDAVKTSGIKAGDDIAEALKRVDSSVLEDALMTLSTMRLTTISNIVWSLAKNADESIPNPKDWLNQFEVVPWDEIVPETLGMVLESSLSKKKYQIVKKAMESMKESVSKESRSQQSTEDLTSTQ